MKNLLDHIDEEIRRNARNYKLKAVLETKSKRVASYYVDGQDSAMYTVMSMGSYINIILRGEMLKVDPTTPISEIDEFVYEEMDEYVIQNKR